MGRLRGGVIVGVGRERSGGMRNDCGLLEEIGKGRIERGEVIWEVGIREGEKKRVGGSKVGDLNKCGGGEGDGIMGGRFIGEFGEEREGVELDIGGSGRWGGCDELGG